MEWCSPHATALLVGPLLRRSPAQEFRGDLNPNGTARVIGIGHGLTPFALALIRFVSTTPSFPGDAAMLPVAPRFAGVGLGAMASLSSSPVVSGVFMAPIAPLAAEVTT
jgi:hypothetical protein